VVQASRHRPPTELSKFGSHPDLRSTFGKIPPQFPDEEKNGGCIIESLRNGWKSEFDFVLVDSRTGVTDIGGICTIQLPDVLSIVFAATEQSIDGAVSLGRKASTERQKLPFDRAIVPILPIPGRFDTQAEQKIAQECLSKFVQSLSGLYDAWLPGTLDRRRFLELTKIPYSPYFSLGEKLPAFEQGTTDPTGLGFAYETVAALISNKLQNTRLLLSNRDEFLRLARSRMRLPKLPLRELPSRPGLFIDTEIVRGEVTTTSIDSSGNDLIPSTQSLASRVKSVENTFIASWSEILNQLRMSLVALGLESKDIAGARVFGPAAIKPKAHHIRVH
jgi:hypothetical protein